MKISFDTYIVCQYEAVNYNDLKNASPLQIIRAISYDGMRTDQFESKEAAQKFARRIAKEWLGDSWKKYYYKSQNQYSIFNNENDEFLEPNCLFLKSKDLKTFKYLTIRKAAFIYKF